LTTKARRSFTDEFKREAVALLQTSGRPLIQIASDLGIRFWRYLGSRLLVPETPDLPPLPHLIRQHAAL
jgi:transposase